ncbi:CheR family methyltransferase [Planctomicrobium piriforme]|uniref:Sensory/regulatory protein RpfC n=1 Tax=Planctomicrobium piriforme TaxID=1576369 RepID=A0A1I3N740_9PLAN|nr:CheR family methyltransferase [Planctomicrobium piriforme]SFJ05009.1 two-component system, chemotaxis family, CheB/CheR fusion protein [Planctomicrobium piriforme]
MNRTHTEHCDFYVAGVGASAGGLEALEEFFRHLPEVTGAAYVVIQHLSPDFESHMPELLGRYTKIPIHLAAEGMEVHPDNIYLIPPKKELIIQEGRLRLTDKDPKSSFTLPIDRFFRSLAQEAGRFSIGIILSGSGSDGSRGIQEIHEAGGLVLVQSEETSKFAGMPQSAISTKVADVILPPQSMPAVLTHYIEYALSREQLAEQHVEISADGGVQQILRLLRDQFDLDFNFYKPQTVLRRIQRRVAILKYADIDEYARELAQNPDLVGELYRDLLIGVTRFFRDKEAFDVLENQVIPNLVEEAKKGEEIRCWVAGCATGEEVYSIAMLLHEALEQANQPVSVKIFATDVHPDSLEFASRGVYPDTAVEDVSAIRKQRYFHKRRDGYHIVQAIRQMVVFATHNVLTDAPFTRMDLVTCRNLLIYFQPAGQKTALSLFHFGLKPSGFLFLGASETIGGLSDDFENIDKRWKIYRKRSSSHLTPPYRRVGPSNPTTTSTRHLSPTAHLPRRGVGENKLFTAYDRLLSRYLPVAFLIDEHGVLLHTFGDGGRFLRVPTGRHSAQLVEMVHDELRPIVSGAIQQSVREGKPGMYSGLKLASGKAQTTYRLKVDPLVDSSGRFEHMLVALEAEAKPEESTGPATAAPLTVTSYDRLLTLEKELRSTQDNLQATIEELETSNEELQATNEEMVASNEELQSTNEELHSVNEELYTVNAEYQKKIVELQEVNEDLDNLVSNSELAVLFLDTDMSIRKFTPQMAQVFHLVNRDIGRPILSFAHQISNTDLRADLQRAIDDNTTVERQVADRFGTPYLLRIVPYRSSVKSSGLVMTLVDISALKAQEEISRKWAAIAESTGDAIIGHDLNGIVFSWNSAAERLYGYSAGEAIGQPVQQLIVPENRLGELDGAIDALRSGAAGRTLETLRRTKAGQVIDVAINLSPIREADRRISGISVIDRDISERRRQERQLAADHAVTQVLADCTTLDQAIPRLLDVLCETLGARVAEFWQQEAPGDELECRKIHAGDFKGKLRLWRSAVTQMKAAPGQELPGITWQSPRAKYFDLREDKQFTDLRGDAAGEAVSCAIGFPLPGMHDPLGVILLYFPEALGEPQDLLGTLSALGQEIGQFAQWADNEEKLRRLAEILERTEDFVATCDMEQRIQTLNPAAKRILGLADDHEVTGRRLQEFQPEWAGERILREGLPGALKHGVWVGETAFLTANHEEIPVSQMLLVHRDAQGSLRYLSTIARNLIEQKQSERELQEARASAEAASAAKSIFLANMSHEVRTPMTAVIGLTELLLDAEQDGNRRHMLEMIQENGQFLTEILNDILDLSKIEAGRLNVDVVDCSIVDVLQEIQPLMEIRSRREGLELRVDYATPIPRRIFTDPIRARQILSNLISNAIKFTEAGKVDVRVEYLPGTSAGRLQVHVRDTGCGIPLEVQEAIFEPFSQVDGKLERRAKGTGLGLSISRRLAEILGGKLSVESTAGEGSTFTLELPTPPEHAVDLVNPDEIVPAITPVFAANGGDGSDHRLQGRRILVAEDTRTNQFLIRRLLEHHGAHVDIVEDGSKAVAVEQTAREDQQPFDIVLMDMHMPQMNGYEASSAIRTAGYRGPIIALTASAMRGDRERCLEAGCTSYATKPIDRTALVNEMVRLLDGSTPAADGAPSYPS